MPLHPQAEGIASAHFIEWQGVQCFSQLRPNGAVHTVGDIRCRVDKAVLVDRGAAALRTAKGTDSDKLFRRGIPSFYIMGGAAFGELAV